MYTPAQFAEERPAVLHALIREFALGTLVTAGPDGPQASLVPMFLDAGRNALRCHLAKSNPHAAAIGGQKALILFQGPSDYVSPSWYPAKAEHGKVVPTWNYCAVEVRGVCTRVEDSEWLVRHVTELTAQQEAAFDLPWAVSDAPKDFIDGLARAIVGVEVAIESMSGKWKLSQNRSRQDRDGAISGLKARRTHRSLELAARMEIAGDD